MNCKVTTHHIYDVIHCNSIVTQSNQLIFNYYLIPLYYPHDVMLTSLIVIHLLYLTCGIMKIFGHKKTQNIDRHPPL
jgi:hypothetical protein